METSLVRWGLILIGPAIGLFAVSALISGLSGHRGAIHSLVFAFAVTLIAAGVCIYLNVGWWYAPLFGWGWLTHLLAGAATGMGVPSLWWPFT